MGLQVTEKDKFIYHFSAEKTEGSKDLIHLLGGKGAHLAEMTSMGLPVPPGFTITADMSLCFNGKENRLPEFFTNQVNQGLDYLEQQTGLIFGSKEKPLLLSVRSGSQVSMPGMMDSILNLGMNEEIAHFMAQKDPYLAWDCYRRLIQMYGDVVLGTDASMFVFIMEDYKKTKKYKKDSDLKIEDLKFLTKKFKEQVIQMTGLEFPENPKQQLFGAIGAVFKSWNNPRAVAYRELHSYSHQLGTAVNVQTMVFGNRGKNSATGVVFTRNPVTGENHLFGEFLPQAQGEDVVAGIRTPFPVCQSSESLETSMPSVFNELLKISKKLETHYQNMQDIEFTIEGGRLWILQTRNAKRSAQAAIRVAVDFVKEGLVTEEEALMSVQPKDLEQLLHSKLDPKQKKDSLCKGLPASPGGASGAIVFSSEDACQKKSYEKVILVREETSPDDIQGMIASEGILTTRGGMTSHAAVVARGMGKCCIVGCGAIQVFPDKKECHVGKVILKEGDIITIDGSTGEVYQKEIPLIKPKCDSYFEQFMQIVEKFSKIKVKANADTVEDAQTAKNFGAKGIGLCRTEHMFFQEDRLDIVRKMILFQDDEVRRSAILKVLLEKQTQDFFSIFQTMENHSVCVRLLDPPLHEFLPQKKEEIEQLAQKWSEDAKILTQQVNNLREVNPMLGHRGCRLAVTFPELYQTQARAIAQAALQMMRQNKKCYPEIMVPLVAHVKEFVYVRDLIQSAVQEVEQQEGVELKIPIGTMIELPQAALCADDLAKEADFFSFGSNDLTQTVLGVSRDDCGRFLPIYIEKGLISVDPFVQLDEKGVGALIALASKKATAVKPDIPISLCGEHGADPQSISFLNPYVTAVSCSPYRIPIARLAVAQNTIKKNSSAYQQSSLGISL